MEMKGGGGGEVRGKGCGSKENGISGVHSACNSISWGWAGDQGSARYLQC